jgi:hypothetical protein
MKAVISVAIFAVLAFCAGWQSARAQVTFQEFQQLPAGSYFNVSVPSYYMMTDVFTKSRLYADRLEMWADPSRRNEKGYQIAQGLGHLGGQLAGGGIEGKGGVFHIMGRLNPCTTLSRADGTDDENDYMTAELVKFWNSLSSTICLESGRLVIHDKAYIEVLNPDARSIGFPSCQPGSSHGGCIETDETQTWEIIPQ